MATFLGEIKRRKVFQVAAVYAVVAWLLVQIVATVEAPLRLPDWVDTLVILLLVVGFPVTLIMSWVFNFTPDGLVKDRGLSEPQAGTGRTLEYVLIGLLVVAVGWIVYRVEFAPAGLTVAETEGDGLPNSIAVLLCDNFSTNPDNDYFAASLHEELLNHLVKLRDLNVIARTSVLQYADAARPITEIAKELRVESVMECSVAYGDGRIVISAQLIDGQTGVHLWSDRYNRELADVFGIQADIARNVASALRAEFSLAAREEIQEPPTSEPAAYALYLEARNAMQTSSDTDRGAVHALLDRAIAIDPQFARAYGAKAFLYVTALGNNTLGSGVSAEERAELIRQVREYAGRALAIDPNEAEARAALRNLYIPEWRWSEYRAALEPEDYDTLPAQQIWAFSWMKDHPEAIRIASRIVEINPNLLFSHLGLAVVLAYEGQREESDEALTAALQLAPADPLSHHWLAINAIAAGDADSGLKQLRVVEQILGDNRPTVFLPELAYAYSLLEENADVERIVNEIEMRAHEEELGVGTWAMAYLAIGDEEQALRMLEAAAEKATNNEVDLGLVALMNLRMNAFNDARLEQPRFANVLDRIRGE